MKKTLYSLMLNEEVVREIDALAHQMGTNRSALINQILADYTSVITPERRERTSSTPLRRWSRRRGSSCRFSSRTR